MSEDKWFHGHISRQKAEELLQNSGIDGSFVVRSSESIAGAYALSVLFNKTVHTYRVLPTDSGLLAVQTLNGVQQRKFKSISELVFEYRNPQNGLIYALTNPVGQATPKLPAFDPITTPVRKDPLPKPPGAAVPPTNRLIQMGVKVIPTDTTKAATATPTDKGRDLPPVPNSREIPPSRVPPSKPTEVKSKESELQTKFVERLNDLKNNYPTVGSGYFDSVQQYASDRGLLADLATIKRGGGQCAELQTLLAKEAVAFQSELERFLTKIDLLRQLFDFGSPPRKNNVYNRTGKDVDLDTFLGRLGDCQTVVKSLNKRACIKLQELMGLGSGSPQVSLPRKQSRNIVPLTDRLFEVKQEGALKYAKHRLKVDVVSGKLTVFKGDGTSNEYDHTQVLQIVKNNKSKTKLLIVLEGNKKREYSFEQSALREAFCQLLQHVRNKHSKSSEPDCVSLFCGTWNMGDAIPPNDISSWFMCQGSGRTLDDMVNSIPHDIYVLGTQETGPPEKEWMHKCMDTVQDITGKSFHLVAMDALWHIKILVFVKEEHKNRISHVKTSSVKTGIANALGNKGAVGVSFQFGGTSFCFINAHLTSGAEKCIRRNNNHYDIMRSLNLGEDRFRDFDLSNRFDHLYFLGDLNYRLEMEVQEILAYLKRGDYGTLAKVDQLRREKDSCKVFSGFDEEEIAFPPTYRYERGTRETYSHLKVKKTGVRINVPSWCDRVLWRSYPETHSICLSYGCSDDIMTSDHSPVFANFQVGVRGQYVSNAGISSHPDNAANTSSISFENVEVILKSPGKSSFYLQFHSVCLTKYVRSKRNSRFDTSDLGPNYVRLGWSKEHVEQLKPIISDREYLVDQHILVSVRSEDDHEIHAECVLALRSMIGTDPQMFEERLTRKGDDIGQIRGRMLVKARGESQRVKEKTYDFIQFGGIKEEDGKKSHMIEEAPMYGDINDTAAIAAQATARITLKSNFRPREHSPAEAKFSPEVAVYGETPAAPEGEYADPEQLSPAPQMVTSPVFPIAERQSPSSMVPTFYSSAQHVSEVPRRKQPSPAPAPAQLEEPLSALPRQQAVNRPPPNPRGSPVIMAPVARQPQPPPSQHTPMTKAARPPSDHSAMFDNALAEFAEIESWIRSAPDTGGNGSSNFHSPGLYDVPSNLPQKTHLDLTSNPPTAGQNAAKTRMQMPTAAATQKARPVSEGPKIPSSVSGFLADLQLEHYAPLLHESGWDSIEFLSDMTEDDLMDAGVTSAQHRHLILEQIHLLAL